MAEASTTCTKEWTPFKPLGRLEHASLLLLREQKGCSQKNR